MAVWQYSFWTIPKDSLEQKYENIPKEITEDDFNDLIWFDKFNKDNLIKKLIFYLLILIGMIKHCFGVPMKVIL